MQKIFKFDNIFKSVIWGGNRISEFKGVKTDQEKIGESWELSPMKGAESVVSNGDWKGVALPELIARDGERIMGRRLMKRFDGKFPLLIKFIDSADDLSVQVHPDDELAQKRHNSFGKTEMWYSIAPSEGAYLYAGFRKPVDPARYKEMIADGTLIDHLRKYYTSPGDFFFLPAGRVHSIGKGNLLLEIQEASDITYRIYDYDRRDKDGKPRQLHVEESVEAVNFNDVSDPVVPNFRSDKEGVMPINSCRYFATELVTVTDSLPLPLPADSFSILICIDGGCNISTADGEENTMSRGETLLVSSDAGKVTLSGDAKVILAYVP